MWSTVVQPVLIAGMVVLEVAVWQVRVALATRGRKRVAAGSAPSTRCSRSSRSARS